MRDTRQKHSCCDGTNATPSQPGLRLGAAASYALGKGAARRHGTAWPLPQPLETAKNIHTFPATKHTIADATEDAKAQRRGLCGREWSGPGAATRRRTWNTAHSSACRRRPRHNMPLPMRDVCIVVPLSRLVLSCSLLDANQEHDRIPFSADEAHACCHSVMLIPCNLPLQTVERQPRMQAPCAPKARANSPQSKTLGRAWMRAEDGARACVAGGRPVQTQENVLLSNKCELRKQAVWRCP
jgi:hypothetical protein